MKIISLLITCLVPLSIHCQHVFNGPLRVSEKNPCYFTDKSGKAILLTGSHTWANFQEMGIKGQEYFDWKGYLNMMVENNHNFIRLWVWEHCWGAAWTDDEVFIDPLPYARTGKELILDGKPKFDLTRWNQAYFDRLRSRILDAGERGIYVSVMLFQGWSLNKSNSEKSDPYLGHPFNKANNINGTGFPNTLQDENDSPTLHSMMLPEILKLQEAYVRKVIETVNDLDNVLYEIINEGGTFAWQQHIVSFIKETEAKMPKQHPVGITSSITPRMLNAELLASNADWVSPANEPQEFMYPGTVLTDDLRNDPAANVSEKVIILDTDHIWGHGGNYSWAWKAFCRGHNPVFMDPWQHLPGRLNKDKVGWIFIKGGICKDSRDYPDWDLLRKQMGVIRELASGLDLVNMQSMERLSSTGFCLANPGSEYVVYFPGGGMATINLTASETEYDITWYIPVLDRWIKGSETLKGGGYVSLEAPFTGDTVLCLRKKST